MYMYKCYIAWINHKIINTRNSVFLCICPDRDPPTTIIFRSILLPVGVTQPHRSIKGVLFSSFLFCLGTSRCFCENVMLYHNYYVMSNSLNKHVTCKYIYMYTHTHPCLPGCTNGRSPVREKHMYTSLPTSLHK